jgi:hypothetical protein
VQLIVYSCNGYPKNEQFDPIPACWNIEAQAYFCNLLELTYAPLSIDIGNNFPVPGNGAWVITYGTNANNWEEHWIWY